MGKIKEVFTQHQNELDDFNKYYSNLYEYAKEVKQKNEFYGIYISLLSKQKTKIKQK